jgi:hypothetical protein
MMTETAVTLPVVPPGVQMIVRGTSGFVIAVVMTCWAPVSVTAAWTAVVVPRATTPGWYVWMARAVLPRLRPAAVLTCHDGCSFACPRLDA